MLWCARGASEGGACPNIFSMLVGNMKVGRGRPSDYGSPLRVPCGSPHRGSPLMFLSAPTHDPKSMNIDVGWPTSLIGGERRCGSEFGSGVPKKNEHG